LDSSKTLLDYGCGHGQDVALLRGMSVACTGWDPVHQPHAEREPADIVNLGYVLNVIEDPGERAQALRQAWNLSTSALVVAAQITFAAPEKELPSFRDGVLTSRGTFQKYYTQNELRTYLEEQVATDAVPAAPGVFYLFKSESAKQYFIASRYRRQAAVPQRRVSELLFEQNLDVLEPFMQVLTRLGRLPDPEELPQAAVIVERFGSMKRALALVERVTDSEPWGAIAKRRSEDLTVYLALARFHRRPPLSQLPPPTQRDIKAFFGNYQKACREADSLLFTAGDATAIDEACQRSERGHLIENALLVHRSALGELEPLLRIYEGCARALVGEVDQANVVKLHRYSGKVSYLAYRNFENETRPALFLRIKVSLRTLAIDFFDYSQWNDPPVLDSKSRLFERDGA
jgi:DNA phosphorothioation-associated putative methyltransferase